MKRLLVVIPSLIIFLSSCKKDADGPYWDTHILGPIINASLNIDNLLPDSILQENPDSSMKIVYQNNVYTLSMDTLFKIPDTILKKVYALPATLTLNPGQVIVNNTAETTYSLPDIQLRTSTIKSGFVRYRVKSYVNEVTTFTYNIPSAKLNGVPFTITLTVPAAVGEIPGISDQIFDLSGYVFDLTGINHDKVNSLYTSVIASISASGQPVLVSYSDSLVVENTFYDMIPLYAKGYFGQNTFNVGPDETEFTLFKRIVGGAIQLEDVNLNFNIRNPVGIDAQLFISNLSSINSRTGTTINLANSIINSPININRASESGGSIYPYNVNFPLTTSNSNIKQMIENLPDKFGYSMQITANPLGNVSGSNDFIYSDNLLDASLDIEIPLSLVANNLTLVDTLDLTISGNASRDVKNGTFTLYADNGFPFDAALQMYLLNDSNNITDSIFSTINIIDEAPVNSNLRVIDKRLTKIAVPVNESKMDLLMNTKRMALKVKFNTTLQPQYIKIYSDYSIDVKLVGDINYTVHTK